MPHEEPNAPSGMRAVVTVMAIDWEGEPGGPIQFAVPVELSEREYESAFSWPGQERVAPDIVDRVMRQIDWGAENAPASVEVRGFRWGGSVSDPIETLSGEKALPGGVQDLNALFSTPVETPRP